MSDPRLRLHRALAGPPDGPTVVLANSLGATLAMWEPQVASLVLAGFRVVRYDMRGHGGTPAVDGPYSIADLALDAVGLLDELGIGRAHVVGLSIGGMVGQWLAAHAPERVDRLVLVATSARLGPPEQWASRADTVLAAGMGAIATAVVGRWFTPAYALRHPALVARMEDMVRSIDAVGYAGCCRAIERMDLVDDLALIRAPTLIVAGAKDPAIPAEHAAVLHARIAGSQLVEVPDAAHLLNVQRPVSVSRLILGHLAGAEAIA